LSVFLEIIIFICYLLIFISYYRAQNLKEKLKQYEFIEDEEKFKQNDIQKTERIYNRFINSKKYDFQLEHEIKFNKQKLILNEFLQILIDLPLFPFFLAVMVFSPWHFNKMMKDLRLKKGRTIIIEQFGMCLADYIGIIILFVCILSFWRWHYTFPTLYRVFQGENGKIHVVNDEINESKTNSILIQKGKMGKLKMLLPTLFFEILIDVFLFLPFLIIGTFTMYLFVIDYIFRLLFFLDIRYFYSFIFYTNPIMNITTFSIIIEK
jgi:hypothetical protein